MPANPDFDDIVTTTLRNRFGKLADNATVTMAFLDRMRRKGKVKPAANGRTIVQEIEAALNSNGSWYSGYDPLNTSSFQPFTAAEYDWKQAAVPVTWTGLEKLQNQGEAATLDLISSRIKNGEKSLTDLVAQASFCDGTGFGGKQLHGLALFVVTTPTSGTVGGIDRGASTFWRNKSVSVTIGTGTNIATTNPSSYIIALNSLSFAATRGTDRPDMYIADVIHYNAFAASLQGLQRVTDPTMATMGFTALKYAAAGVMADFVLDNGYCTANTTFALNTDYLYLRPHPDRNFVSFGGNRQPINQDATIQFVGFAGNMCAANLALQGKLFQN